MVAVDAAVILMLMTTDASVAAFSWIHVSSSGFDLTTRSNHVNQSSPAQRYTVDLR